PFGTWLARLGAFECDETGAVALHTREILVAGGLVDAPFRTAFGFEGFHRQAVGGHGAVTTALAHFGVDVGAQGRVGVGAALAPAPLLGGTGLVVDQHGGA